ncbi:MAG TPA: GNAT family N-acetyltransferase [Candidatus Dormibacteraeota bacterium]|nr:GNAT family N-acetyltransferase [Candidatus Dormibacteraeota bacterium]
MEAADVKRLAAFFGELSDDSLRLRFFGLGLSMPVMAAHMVDAATDGRGLGLIALAGGAGQIVAHAMAMVTKPGRAEVAFAVADDHAGTGLATIMLGQLAELAATRDISVFEAVVLPENHRMISVFRESGFQVTTKTEPGEILVEFPATLDAGALRRFEAREHEAAAAAVRAVLRPRSVAVIGASRRRGGIAAEVFHNLLSSGFNGPVYAVNPASDVVQSVPAYPSILEVPGEVDLAVIVVPAPAVLAAVRNCATKGVRSLVVISSGFGETGPRGARLQEELLNEVRRQGMRLVGPNCMGVMNTDPAVSLNATFAPHFPKPGNVAFMSQSGGLGLAIIEVAARLGLGLSCFLSVGNKADISGNDLIQYCEDDPGTDLVLLYLESFGNPRKFARLARRVSQKKPIVAVKAGRTGAGARAAGSHTGAMLAASDITVDALFRQSGVIRTDTLAEMFDVAALLSNQPVPAGGRVGIVTNAGGPGILCADACEARGLEVVGLPAALARSLRRALPANASVTNPIDMTAAASAENYGKTIEALATAGVVDAIIVIFVPPLVTDPDDVARALRRSADRTAGKVTLCSVFMSAEGLPEPLGQGGQDVPSFAFPEEAAMALAHAAKYGEWRGRPRGAVPELAGIDEDQASAVLAHALRSGPVWMAVEDAATVLAAYGIPMVESRLAATPAAAGRAAQSIGGRVALKAVATGVLHKSDAGGVRLGLKGARATATAAADMLGRVPREGDLRFQVQRMAAEGVELLVGVVNDPLFGQVLACGAGGATAELQRDVQVRLTPVTDVDVAEMLSGLRIHELLTGYRGSPAVDLAGLRNLLLRVGAMVEAHPEISELDLNPVIARPDGVVAVDWRMRVASPTRVPPLGSR